MLVDDFKGDLKSTLRVVVKFDLQTEYRFSFWDGTSKLVQLLDVKRNVLVDYNIDKCLIPVGTDRVMTLRHALYLINEIGECSDG